MKRITKLSGNLNEFRANQPVVEPGVKPAEPATKPTPKVNPATPPKPAVAPVPKNKKTFISGLENLMKRWNKLKGLNESKINEMVFDGFRAWIIPNDKRDQYFEIIDKFHNAKGMTNAGYEAHRDPIIVFNDFTSFTEQNQKAWVNAMNRIGAKEITDVTRLAKLSEATDIDTGLDPKLNDPLKKGTTNDLAGHLKDAAEVSSISDKIAELESEIPVEDLQIACEDVIREIFGKADERFDISLVDFKLTILRDGKSPSALDPRAVAGNKKMGASVAQVHKRRLINFLTQGFAFGTFNKLFDEDVQKQIDFIDSQIQKMYFKYFETMARANSKVPIADIKAMVDQLAKLGPAGVMQAVQMNGGKAIQATVKVEYGEKPTIVAEAGNFITLFHEAIKGVYELVSHWGLSKYTEEELTKIYSETEGWVEEYRAFKYGGKVVEAFIKFLNSIAQKIDGKDADYVCYPACLAWLYNAENVTDEEFVKLMESIVANKPTAETIEYGTAAYNSCHGIETRGPIEKDADVGSMSLDDLLDKVSKVGMAGLSAAEKARLEELASNESVDFQKHLKKYLKKLES